MEKIHHIKVGDKVVVTTDNWFYGHDGKLYRGVYGTVHGVETAEGTLGVKTNARSTNWYLVVGNMTIAGCQIHYVAKVSDEPTPYEVEAHTVTDQGEVKKYRRPSDIYNADALGENNVKNLKFKPDDTQHAEPESPAAADYESVLADHRRLVRKLDILLNGEGAAEQASLCDIVSQVQREGIKSKETLTVPHGWQIVPIEPTEEMLNQGESEWSPRYEAKRGYKAMLKAAPGYSHQDGLPILSKQELIDLIKKERAQHAEELNAIGAGVKRDAERYRWLRTTDQAEVKIFSPSHGILSSDLSDNYLDTTIDAAMEHKT